MQDKFIVARHESDDTLLLSGMPLEISVINAMPCKAYTFTPTGYEISRGNMVECGWASIRSNSEPEATEILIRLREYFEKSGFEFSYRGDTAAKKDALSNVKTTNDLCRLVISTMQDEALGRVRPDELTPFDYRTMHSGLKKG